MDNNTHVNNGQNDLPLEKAKPYRSPTELSEKPARVRPFAAWVAVFGVILSAVLAYAYARQAADENLTDHVRGFSGYRGEVEEDDSWHRGGEYWDAYHEWENRDGSAEEG